MWIEIMINVCLTIQHNLYINTKKKRIQVSFLLIYLRKKREKRKEWTTIVQWLMWNLSFSEKKSVSMMWRKQWTSFDNYNWFIASVDRIHETTAKAIITSVQNLIITKVKFPKISTTINKRICCDIKVLINRNYRQSNGIQAESYDISFSSLPKPKSNHKNANIFSDFSFLLFEFNVQQTKNANFASFVFFFFFFFFFSVRFLEQSIREFE